MKHNVLVGTALVAFALAGCGGSKPGNDPDHGTPLSGAVVIDGSSTVAPLSEAAADIYREERPGVNVTVATSGTGGGFEKFCKGETDIADASRPIKTDDAKEGAACAAGGIEYTELKVATDALTVVVHKDNTWADCLTVAELKRIWEPNSRVDNWSQVRTGFPNEPLGKDQLFGPGTDSGTFDYFTEEINGEVDASRTDYTASENDNVLVQGVASTRSGLGYFGYTYFEENRDQLKALEIDAGAGCVSPSPETAQNGSYRPLARPLFIYVNNRSFKDKPQVADFVEFYVDNIDEIVREARFIGLNPTERAALDAGLAAMRA